MDGTAAGAKTRRLALIRRRESRVIGGTGSELPAGRLATQPATPRPTQRGPTMKLLVPAVVLALGVLTPACAGAHEFWLAPSSYRAARGDTLRATAFVGTGFRGGLKPYAATRAVTWVARGSRLVDLKPESVNGDDVFGRWVPDDDGGVLFAYESNFVPIELPAEEFDAYLELEGLDGPRAERAKLGALAGDGRERYERCPKAWVAGRDSRRVTAAVGLSLELVPATDPSLPGPLKLRLLFRGEPLPGTLVRAWN